MQTKQLVLIAIPDFAQLPRGLAVYSVKPGPFRVALAFPFALAVPQALTLLLPRPVFAASAQRGHFNRPSLSLHAPHVLLASGRTRSANQCVVPV